MTTRNIELTNFCSISHNGVVIDLFIGDACEPVLTDFVSFEDMIDSELESMLVEDRFANCHVLDIKNLLDGLESAVQYAKDLAAEYGYTGEDS
jgi:hypothetical protein